MIHCTVQGCERQHRARGFCAMHYVRWAKHGDPSVVKPPGFPKRPRAACKFPGCEQLSKRGGRGWCGKHYTRWFRHGDPSVDKTHAEREKKPVIERIMARVDVGPGCWEWLGPKLPAGYGYVGARRHKVYVHRALYEHHQGPIPADHQIHHTCQNKGCCNPAHLVALTRKEHVAAHVEARKLCLSQS